jgi:hypothetical protein
VIHGLQASAAAAASAGDGNGSGTEETTEEEDVVDAEFTRD